MEMYRLSTADLLVILNEKTKRKLTEKDLFSETINLSILKRIDKIFKMGLHFYLDPNPPFRSKDISIFFRVEKFGAEPNLRAKHVVRRYENMQTLISSVLKMAEIKYNRVLPKFDVSDNPHQVAEEIRRILYPKFVPNQRDFLKGLIELLAKKNVFVFEFNEAPTRKEKANIDGFYLKPNLIVIKRHSYTFRREIYTLAHELGHLLLDREEIDLLEYDSIADRQLNEIERWCHDFAYYFLAGPYAQQIDLLKYPGPVNDYYHDEIDFISNKTHLSTIALYTRLLFQDQITYDAYSTIRREKDERFRQMQEEMRRIQEIRKAQGKATGFGQVVLIDSPLFINAIQAAFFDVKLSPYEVSKRFDVKQEKVEQYIQ